MIRYAGAAYLVYFGVATFLGPLGAGVDLGMAGAD